MKREKYRIWRKEEKENTGSRKKNDKNTGSEKNRRKKTLKKARSGREDEKIQFLEEFIKTKLKN